MQTSFALARPKRLTNDSGASVTTSSKKHAPAPAARAIDVPLLQTAVAALSGEEPGALLKLLEKLPDLYPDFSEDLEDCAESLRWRVRRRTHSNRDLVLEAISAASLTLATLIEHTELSLPEVRDELAQLQAEHLIQIEDQFIRLAVPAKPQPREGAPAPHTDLLLEVLKTGSYTASDLAQKTRLSGSTVYRTLKQLQAQRLITSFRDPQLSGAGGDQRTLIYALTKR